MRLKLNLVYESRKWHENKSNLGKHEIVFKETNLMLRNKAHDLT